MSKRNIYITDEVYASIKEQAGLESRSIANYLVWLHERYLQSTSTKNTGKTLIEVFEDEGLLDDGPPLNSGRRDRRLINVGPNGKERRKGCEGVKVSKLKRDLDEIVTKTFRPYTKEMQTGKKK